MFGLLTRAALLASALCSVSALAGPLEDPPTLAPPFAFAMASYDAGGGASDFHFGEGTATVGFTNPFTHITTTYATATAAYSPVTALSVTATNPGVTSGKASAHAEVHYQYLVTLEGVFGGPGFGLNFAYDNLISLSGVGSIETGGPSASVRLTTSANSDIDQQGTDFGHAFNDSSSDVAYTHTSNFQVAGAGQYVKPTIIGGKLFFNFIGFVTMAADVYGETHQETVDINGVPTLVFVNNHPGATGFAYLDPLITINPLFVQQYGLIGGTVTLSPGIANGGATVPEPAAWALLITGFGLTGVMARRRRVTAAA